MRKINRRDALAILLVALVSGTLFVIPALNLLVGNSLDILVLLRWKIFGNPHDPATAPAVVIVIDEESYHTPPFDGTPTILWTREIGRVVTAVLDGGASVIGFDIVFPTSIEQSEVSFDDAPLGARLRGFDRDFLRALATAARTGKIVLGEVQNRTQPISPSPGQRVAVGGQRNIRALNGHIDSDGVIRRLPLTFKVDERLVPSMAVELASRAQGTTVAMNPDGTLTIAGYTVPTAVPNTMTLNFAGGGNDIPTYSFADLWRCAQKPDAEFFHRNFDGKVVLIGTLLDIEDRKLTSKRFATGVEGTYAPRCALPVHGAAAPTWRNTIPGVYVHATAVNDLLRHDAVVELDAVKRSLTAIAVAAVSATAAIAVSPVNAVLIYLATIGIGVFGITWAFTKSLALPLIEPAIAGLLAMGTLIVYRVVVLDKEKRFLRKVFSLYLAPQVVERMLASNKPPALGGEIRDVTIFFSDIAGFSSITEKLAPDQVVSLMNEYLSAMTDIIERNGGFVDKYIGDSIVAVFGAPTHNPDHARDAVQSALQCRTRLAELNLTSPTFRGYKLAHRIGLNSGDALVGNIGSRRHFNYTVMSDAVNLASRLEGANKYFGTSIMASHMTVARAGPEFMWRELDEIRVKGRATPVKIYDLLDQCEHVTVEQRTNAWVYAEGLAHWREADFVGAARCFERVSSADLPSALFLERARAFITHPPGPGWDPVLTLEGK